MNGSALTWPPNNAFDPDGWLAFARRRRSSRAFAGPESFLSEPRQMSRLTIRLPAWARSAVPPRIVAGPLATPTTKLPGSS